MRSNNHQTKVESISKHGTKKESNMEAHRGLKSMLGDIRITQRQHGTKGETKIKIRLIRKWVEPMSTFHLDGWMLVLGTNWMHCLVYHIPWFLLCLKDKTCEGGGM